MVLFLLSALDVFRNDADTLVLAQLRGIERQIVNTPKGADASAIIYSIMETVKERGLKPFEYFQHLLEELPQIDRNDKEKRKRYLPYSDVLPAYCKAPDQERNN